MDKYRSILKNSFEDACNAYLRAFCDKHGYDYEDARDSWAAGDVGGIAMCGDQFVSMETIRTDIDMDAPEGEFLKWYDYCSELGMLDLPSMTFRNWLLGCPRMPRESIDNIRERKQEINDLIREAKETYGAYDGYCK